VFTNIASGVREDRSGLKEMISCLRPRDMVVVYKIDRIFRSLKNLVELIDYFNRHQVQFKSLSEPAFDTTSSNEKFLLQIFEDAKQN
jgi:DNA invertase Pin-like site-specific DNA recombinase